VLTEEHLTLKKPGTGILYDEINQVIGRYLKVDKDESHLLTWDDLE